MSAHMGARACREKVLSPAAQGSKGPGCIVQEQILQCAPESVRLFRVASTQTPVIVQFETGASYTAVPRGIAPRPGWSEAIIVVECRGKKEDRDLELEFRRICDGANRWNRQLPFAIKFADKKTNSSGLQLADLVARPIGLSVLRPDKPNRAFEVLKRKFFCKGGRQKLGVDFEGWGLKIFPDAESEKPR